MRRTSLRLYAAVALVAFATVATVEARQPETLSPGGREAFSSTQETSPTFSWVAVAGATSVDLLVFALPEGFPPPGDPAVMAALAALEPAVWVPLPGGASSWTLPAEWSLDPGVRCAWLIRAVGEDRAERWSAPSFFEVLAAPSTAEVRQAMDVLAQYLASQPGTAGAAPSAARQPMKIVTRTTAPPDAKAPAIPAGPTAIKGDVGGTSGATYGVMGISHSSEGAGVVGVNTGGGALVMGFAGDTLLFTVGGDGTVWGNAFVPACGAPLMAYPDNDDDTYGASERGVRACSPPAGYVTTAGDCDDGNPTVNPAGAEVCDGIDNNCDDETDNVDGTGLPCNTGQQGVCAEGVTQCQLDGLIGCEAINQPSEEMCDGQDNDCDGLADEDFPVGEACDTGQPGVCGVGEWQCSGEESGIVCQETAWPEQEQCDNLDNDCNGMVDENLQQPCYDGAAGTEGVGACHGGEQTCDAGAWGLCVGQALPEPEACNGIDDDCNGSTDEGDPGGGGACNTGLQGVCAAGTTHCQSGSLQCVQDVEASAEVCDGLDNNCDGVIDDGNPGGGAPCDGADTDLCAEGTITCDGGALTCSDTTGNLVDLCNGVDDDCDAASADGSEDPQVGAPCDGPDSDLCAEGTSSCAAGALTCSDMTGGLIDICNGVDDDCDPASADGSEDPQYGAACDGLDADLCTDDYVACLAGQLVCADAGPALPEICGNGVDDDCDGSTDEGC